MQSEFLRVDVQRLGRELRQQHLQSRVSAHRIIEKHTYAKREKERDRCGALPVRQVYFAPEESE
jgi:hypothetical protein